MKHKVLTIATTLTLLAIALPAGAQAVRVDVAGSASSTPTRARAEVKAEAQVRQASSTEKRLEMQLNIAKRKALNTSRVLTATVERLEGILSRIESRMEKIRAEGGVTAESEVFVVEAKKHLSNAKTEIALFASVDLSGEKLSENFSKLREIASETKMHIREAHRSLMNTVRTMKGMSSARANATTTVE